VTTGLVSSRDFGQ